MGLVDQGWICRCDVCGWQADGITKTEVIKVARARGFKCVRMSYWFCHKNCLNKWIRDRENKEGFSESLINEARRVWNTWTNKT